MTPNKDKCKFKTEELIYLGHKITSKGIEPDDAKVKSIMEIPTPQDKKDVQRLLGPINYVGKFVPSLAEITAPLREVIRKNKEWTSEEKQANAFQWIKDVIVSKKYLAFYDVSKPVAIQVDACKSGIGAVLIQDDVPVAYASKSLTPTQERYAPIEQEMLAVVFGCARFHQYIYGKKSHCSK